MIAACASPLFRISETLAVCFSLALNSLLLLGIWRCKTKDLRVYSRLIVCNSAVDTLFAITSYIIEIHADVRNWILMVFNDGIDLSVDPFALFVIYLCALYSAVTIVAVPMVYRYMAVCRNIVLSKNEIMLLVLIALVAAAVVPVAVVVFWLSASIKTSKKFAETIRSYPCNDAGEIYVSSDISVILPAMIASSCVIMSMYICVVLSAVKVHRFIRKANFGSKKDTLQRQVGHALMAQAIAPVFTVVLPLGTIVVAGCFGLDSIHTLIMSATCFCSWIPVLNPVMTMYFIKPYRNVLTEKVLRRAKVTNQPSEP